MTKIKFPTPILIALIIIGTVALMYLASQMPFIMTCVTLLCWSLVGLTLLYVAGMYPKAIGLPVIGLIIKWLASSMSPQTTHHLNAKPSESKVDRDKLVKRAIESLMRIQDRHRGIEFILNTLVPLARDCSSKKKLLFGVDSAWIGIIFGPVGVGKSAVAKSLVDLLIGLNVVESTELLALPHPDNRNSQFNWNQVLTQSLGHVLLIDNAGWLADRSVYGQVCEGEEFLKAVASISKTNPGQLCIIVSMTTEQRDSAFGTSESKEFIRKIMVAHIECEPIKNDDLIAIFRAELVRHHLTVSDDIDGPLRRVIVEQRSRHQDKFDHVYTVKKIIEQLRFYSAEQNKSHVTASDFKVLINKPDFYID